MIRSMTIIGCLMAAMPAAAQEIVLPKGGVQIVAPGVLIGTVVVGDPNVADVAVEGDDTVLVFGKSVGQTELVVFGRDRTIAHSSVIQVVPAVVPETVTVRKGAERGLTSEDWLCRSGGCTQVIPAGTGGAVR